MIRVLIVDDHGIFRIAIKNILQADSDIEVVGEFGDHSVLNVLSELKPDVIMCDLSLEKESGLDLMKKIKKFDATIKLLVMSMHKDEFHILQAIENGAVGYLYKGDQPKEVLNGIKHVAKGEQYFSPNIQTVYDNQIKNNPNNHSSQLFLTKKEKEVIHFIMKGLTSKEIAEQMNLSSRTVEAHRYNILNKLGFRNTGELIKSMADHKLDFL